MIIFLWILIRNISCIFFVWFSFVQKHILTIQEISMSYCWHTQSTQKHSGAWKYPIALKSLIGSTNSIVLVNPSSSANQIALTNLINSTPLIVFTNTIIPNPIALTKKGEWHQSHSLSAIHLFGKEFYEWFNSCRQKHSDQKKMLRGRIAQNNFPEKQKTDVRDIRFLCVSWTKRLHDYSQLLWLT